MSGLRSTLLAAALAAALILVSTTPCSAHESDPAAAQALFYEARALMKEGRYALACPKFEESLRQDYGIGTEFNLADCNEHLGRLASAWSGFLNVASAAKVQNQPQRERVARERAKALEPRLAKLVIEVPAGAPPGLEVKRDGVAVGNASWGTPVPIDPGPHRITVEAPGKQPWEGTVSGFEARTSRIMIPRVLASAPVAGAEPEPANKPQEAAAFPPPVVEQRGATQRTAGWITAGLGVAALGVGAGFGIDSLRKRENSKDFCQGNVCEPEGVHLRQQAIDSGDVATITTIAGGAALVGGIVLLLTAPKSTPGEAPRTGSIRALPQVATNGGGLTITGVLP
jgi:serine/threonine-protein kinase